MRIYGRSATIVLLCGGLVFLGERLLAPLGAATPNDEKAKPAAAKEADKKKAAPAQAGLDFFEAKIRPVLVAKCYECHSADSKEIKGGLALDTRAGIRKGGESGPSVVPGNVKDSLLVEAIRREGLEMPPDEPLADAVVADFVRWIEMGAPDPREGKAAVRKIDLVEGRKHWSFQPVGKPTPPAVKDAAWPAGDVDRYLLAALEAKGLKPVGDADPATLLRRVTLDLTGLQPTPAEIDAFVADPSPKAYAKVVDRLLASPQFGERWGRHWLDIARFGESTGKERNIPYPVAWRYRDYVVDSFNADKPYDQFITEQVAGDLLPAKTAEERDTNLIATGFLAMGPKGVNERNAELYKLDVVDEQIDVVCRAVMATTASCARCHDHKFDPIPQKDYYALAGIFRSTSVFAGAEQGSRAFTQKALLPLESKTSTAVAAKEDDKPAKSSSLSKDERKKLEKELAAVDEKLADLRKNAKNGKAKEAARKEAGQLLREQERLTALLGSNAVATTPIKGKKNGKNDADQNIDLSVLAMGAREGKPTDVALRIRGEESERGDVVPRGFLSVLQSSITPKIEPDHSGRLELARWLTQKDNPLTARVLANRIWFHLFGTGIVETIDNFGSLGERPSHPELLDALARYVMDHGWSVKQTIREVVLSRAYRLSSDHNDANYAVDPANELVWRMNRRRLDAEIIRDMMLASAGTLDLNRPEGSPVALRNGEIGRSIDVSTFSRDSHHRSVYLPAVRGQAPEMLGIFDVADSSLVVGQREVTTVATQALYMLNSPFVLEQSDATADRILGYEPSDDARRADLAYRLVLARPATSHEKQRAAEFVRAYGADLKQPRAAWSALCQVLFSSAEFRYAY